MFKEFEDFAKREISAIHHEHQSLEGEEKRIRKELEAIINKRTDTIIKDNALSSYISACATDRYTCPSCFIRRSISVKMTPVPSDNINNFFKCSHCSSSVYVKI